MNDSEYVSNFDYEDKIKSALKTHTGFDTDADIIRWMYTPHKSWSNLSPATMIAIGRGETVLKHVESWEK